MAASSAQLLLVRQRGGPHLPQQVRAAGVTSGRSEAGERWRRHGRQVRPPTTHLNPFLSFMIPKHLGNNSSPTMFHPCPGQQYNEIRDALGLQTLLFLLHGQAPGGTWGGSSTRPLTVPADLVIHLPQQAELV